MSRPGTWESRRTDFFDLPEQGGLNLFGKGHLFDPDTHADFLVESMTDQDRHISAWGRHHLLEEVDPSALALPDIACPFGGKKCEVCSNGRT